MLTDDTKFAAQRARERMTGALARLTDLRREIQQALSEAHGYTDPHLTADGLNARRRQMVEQTQGRFGPRIQQLRAQVQNDAEAVRRWLDATRPTLADDPASIMRAQIKWDQARMKLEAGMTAHQLISSADLETVMACREWLPGWQEARSYASRGASMVGDLAWEAPDSAMLLRSIDDRLAELSGGVVADAVRASRDVEQVAAGAAPTLDYLDLASSGQPADPMLAAIESHYAAQAAITTMPAESDASAAAALAGS